MVYIPNDGLEYLSRYCTQSTAGYFAWTALDDGLPVEAAGTTALTNEITTNGGERALAAVSYEASYKAVWQKTFSFTASFSIQGIGIFNQLIVAGSKILMLHALAAVKNVDSGETMATTQKLAFGR